MKRILFFISLALFCDAVNAQYYYIPHRRPFQNPGGLNADAEENYWNNLQPGWTVIFENTVSKAVNSKWTAKFSIPFAFKFNGQAVTQYQVATSGVVTFTANKTEGTNGPLEKDQAALPSAEIPDKSICMWGLKKHDKNDRIAYKTFGTAPNRQHWILFHSYGSAIVTQEATSVWMAVVLEETSNKIYVVDMRCIDDYPKLTVGIQIDGSTAINVAGSPTYTLLSKDDPTTADNAYYEFLNATQPKFDMTPMSISTSEFLLMSQGPFDIKGKLENLGSTTISSLDLNYTVNGGAPVTANLKNLGLKSYGVLDFTHPTKWTPPATGTYKFKLWASNLNGGSADNVMMNDTITFYLNVVNAGAQRLPLHEMFTSSANAADVTPNTSLKSLFDANPGKFTCIKYPMPFPGGGDPYFNDDCLIRRTYYNCSATPLLYLDGVKQNATTYSGTEFNARYNVSTYMNMSATWSYSGTTININGSITPMGSFASPHTKLQVAIVEKTTTGNWTSNGETEFYYIQKKMLPDGYGKPVTIESGKAIGLTQSYKFSTDPNLNTVEEYSDLAVVAFIQDDGTKEVLFSGWLTYKPTGIDNPEDGDGLISLYPNPATDCMNMDIQLLYNDRLSVVVYNSLGEKVAENDYGNTSPGIITKSISTNGWARGLYRIKLNIGDKAYDYPVSVQ